MRGELPDRSDWLLERVARQDWLRDEFIDLDHSKRVTWNQAAAVKYKKSVDGFLRRLFLLIHLASGQPARGTELLSLRHSNTMQGHHRRYLHRPWYGQHSDLLSQRIYCHRFDQDHSSLFAEAGWRAFGLLSVACSSILAETRHSRLASYSTCIAVSMAQEWSSG
jgi:hypothetical protein